ncbi:uncharacterized protein LOC113239532 [Hyposmocoma kahamanoa]|uniref:uncharacterized protein LOC113239532 n=1 Tax=Hyposmocoma kahamanoa TaxID=1477025 RepID=UPI000E6D76C7|nr:uncharacterized protein LOC113239532 [Hyposmocoma kahamanoa]
MHLQKLGYRVDLIEESWRDYCIMELCGQEVFRCNVRHLKFNTCVERDPVAQCAVNAVIAGTSACLRARNNLWLKTVLKDEIFQRNEYSPKNYWPFPVNLTPLVYECPTCCGSLSIKYHKKKKLIPSKPQEDYIKPHDPAPENKK